MRRSIGAPAFDQADDNGAAVEEEEKEEEERKRTRRREEKDLAGRKHPDSNPGGLYFFERLLQNSAGLYFFRTHD